jgi:RHS repeat-associated protein
VYSSYGSLIDTQNALGQSIRSNPVLNTQFTYAGLLYEPEGGIYYAQARYYNPDIGRFLQKDPNPGQLGLPITVTNAYVYAGNSPHNLTDPSGASFLSGLVDALAVVAAIALVAVAIVTANPELGELAESGGLDVGMDSEISTVAVDAATTTATTLGGTTGGILLGGGTMAAVYGQIALQALSVGSDVAQAGAQASNAASAVNSAGVVGTPPSAPIQGPTPASVSGGNPYGNGLMPGPSETPTGVTAPGPNDQPSIIEGIHSGICAVNNFSSPVFEDEANQIAISTTGYGAAAVVVFGLTQLSCGAGPSPPF